jgi:hypothetical protein
MGGTRGLAKKSFDRFSAAAALAGQSGSSKALSAGIEQTKCPDRFAKKHPREERRDGQIRRRCEARPSSNRSVMIAVDAGQQRAPLIALIRISQNE